MPAPDADRLLVQRIRDGEPDAWEQFIARFEGRLLAFADSRLRDRAKSEDVVQEAFLGFLVGLPNFDERRPLESWLFSITAHKLTDVLRRSGRRPTVPLFGSSAGDDDDGPRSDPPGRARVASSLARSREGRTAQAAVLAAALGELIDGWKANGEWERLETIELLFVLGVANKDVARRLDISEQAVANHKSFVVGKLKDAALRSSLRDKDLSGFGV